MCAGNDAAKASPMDEQLLEFSIEVAGRGKRDVCTRSVCRMGWVFPEDIP